MISLIQSLKPVLPTWFWRGARDFYWRQFWLREQRFERSRLGMNAPDLSRSERATVIERVSDCYPFSSVLEIGCSFGQNFYFLAPLFPEARFVGVDLSPERIFQGKEFLSLREIQNATLIEGNAEDIAFLRDNSFDVVFTSAFFLYIRPESARAVAREMVRLSRRFLFLVEQQYSHPADPAGGLYVPRIDTEKPGYWLRDYEALFQEVAPHLRVSTRRIHGALWEGEQWQNYGSIIEIQKP